MSAAASPYSAQDRKAVLADVFAQGLKLRPEDDPLYEKAMAALLHCLGPPSSAPIWFFEFAGCAEGIAVKALDEKSRALARAIVLLIAPIMAEKDTEIARLRRQCLRHSTNAPKYVDAIDRKASASLP